MKTRCALLVVFGIMFPLIEKGKPDPSFAIYTVLVAILVALDYIYDELRKANLP